MTQGETLARELNGSKATQFKPVHGRSGDNKAGGTYLVWISMIARCERKSHKSYGIYGGAGVTICERWRNSFQSFLDDMGERPKGMTLDRYPNSRGNYEPGNCRWADAKQQARNRSTNLLIEAFGESRPLCEWAEKYGIRADTLVWRIRRGMSPEVAMTTPVKRGNPPIPKMLEGRIVRATSRARVLEAA